MSGTVVLQLSDGSAVFDAISVVLAPSTRVSIDASLSFSTPEGAAQTVTGSVSVYLEQCNVGYAVQEVAGTSGRTECYLCEDDEYTFERGESSCETCPGHTTCKGDQLVVDAGFWRHSAGSSLIRQCSRRLVGVCQGGKNASNSQCREGHRGPMCGQCAADWSLDEFAGSCVSCTSDGRGLNANAQMLLGLLITGLLISSIMAYYHKPISDFLHKVSAPLPSRPRAN